MQPIRVIAGPTAVGKSSTAVELAHMLQPAEIVSCDSRQIYRGMDIGTAKPSAAERQAVPHHFVDEREVTQTFSAGAFQAEAEIRLAAILDRGHVPIVAGGSTLYLKALVEGIGRLPVVPAVIRKNLNHRLETEGAPALYDTLVEVDPIYAATLDPTKTQRIIRGLEVYEATGRSLSSFQSDHRPPRYAYQVFVLSRPRSDLYEAINKRVDSMMEYGLLQEVQRFHEAGFSEHDAAFRTIGYRELFPVLRNEYSIEHGVHLIKRNSRRYAKRQLTWYRGMHSVTWLDVSSLTPVDVASVILGSQRRGTDDEKDDGRDDTL